MPDDLLSELTSKPQRETAGADSAARFDYQKDWAFCRMVQMHTGGDDYLIAFEYHDDVLFLTPSGKPTKAEFCQVKTSSATSPRKLTTLTTRPKGKASILAKMFSNFEGICASNDVQVVLVSNNAFEFSDKNVCAKDLDQKFRNKLIDKLEAEISGFDKKQLEKLHFMVVGVSLEAMKSFLEGEAMELFCGKYGEDHGLNVRTWIRLLKGEISRRNNYPSDQITTTDDLIKHKCIDPSLVEKTLEVLHSKSRKPVDFAAISSYLATIGWAQLDIMRLQKNVPQASRDYYDPLNKDVKEIVANIRAEVSGQDGQPIDFSTFLKLVATKTKASSGILSIYRQDGYLYALGSLVYYDEV